MKLAHMKPTATTSGGQHFHVLCVMCCKYTRSDVVLCDEDGSAGDFYCPDCVQFLTETSRL